MKIKINIIAGVLLSMAALPACAQSGVVTLAGSGITVTDKSAELTPTGMTVGMDLCLDSLKLRSSKRIVLTPAVKGRGVERVLPEIIVNGRRQEIEYKRKDRKKYSADALDVRRKNGTEQTVHYTAVLPYEEWMKNSDVVIDEDLCGCGNVLANDATAVYRLRTPLVAYVRPAAEVKSRSLEGSAYIDFPVDKTNLYPDYRRNPTELQKIVDTINEVKEDGNVTIDGIDICGHASPESPYEHNAYLAEARAETIKTYVRSLVNLDDKIFTVSSVPEDWDGLREAVAESNLTNKDAILALIDDNTLEPDPKEWKIKASYPDDYAIMLATFYPALRRTNYTVSYTVRPFSVEEARAMLETNPRQLSLEEMYLVAQTCEPGTEEFDDVFATAARLYPDDPTANLNAACSEIERGDYEAAKHYLAKAGETPEAWNARGVTAAHEGDAAAATELFTRAADAGLPVAKENLDIMQLQY